MGLPYPAYMLLSNLRGHRELMGLTGIRKEHNSDLDWGLAMVLTG